MDQSARLWLGFNATTPGRPQSLARTDHPQRLHLPLNPVIGAVRVGANALPNRVSAAGVRRNLYNTDGKLVDHGTFIPDGDSTAPAGPGKGSSELKDLVKALALEATMRAAVAAAPHVERWLTQQALPAVKTAWNNQALPAMRSTWKFVSRKRAMAVEPAPEAGPIRVTATVGEEPSRELVAALESFSTGTSEVDARERFVAALMAQLLSEDGQLFLEVQARMRHNAGADDLDAVSTEQVGESIKRMLEEDPALIDELVRALGPGRIEG
ncbi:hypothetical protein AB0M02_22605 [Actinoplanes sp. NPDC051861]|uniref:hypothetical protein n=1 Tax=Actinoplanes sp. NPDC051861 TaxID=3155170 RepID=UPI00341C6FF7